jgi:hypothetical protein
MREAGSQKRIDEMFTLAKEYAPRLFEQITGIRRLKKLVAGLSDENIEQLVTLKVVDTGMAKLAREIRDDEHARTERTAKILGIKKPDAKPGPAADGVVSSGAPGDAPAEATVSKGAAE